MTAYTYQQMNEITTNAELNLQEIVAREAFLKKLLDRLVSPWQQIQQLREKLKDLAVQLDKEQEELVTEVQSALQILAEVDLALYALKVKGKIDAIKHNKLRQDFFSQPLSTIDTTLEVLKAMEVVQGALQRHASDVDPQGDFLARVKESRQRLASEAKDVELVEQSEREAYGQIPNLRNEWESALSNLTHGVIAYLGLHKKKQMLGEYLLHRDAAWRTRNLTPKTQTNVPPAP